MSYTDSLIIVYFFLSALLNTAVPCSLPCTTPSGFDKNCVAKVPVMAFILQGRCLWFVREISTL